MDDFSLWIADKQPDILGGGNSFGNIEWTYEEIINNIYEKLRAEFPEYINRKEIGKDSSGKYKMYAYEFCPDNYEKTFYIQSGVHCIETEGYFGLARLMYLVAHEADDRFAAMKKKIRFLIVPCVSVYGVSTKGDLTHIMSDKRYEIENSIYGINPNRDFVNLLCAETRAVKAYFSDNAADITFAFDFHTTTMAEWNAYLFIWADGMDAKITEKHKHISEMLYKNCKTDFPMAYNGPEANYPTGSIKGSFVGGFFTEFGINAVTVEHSDYIFDKSLGTSAALTRAVELYANHVMLEAEV